MINASRTGVPRRWRFALDWVATIVAAVLIVLALKAWVVAPYRIPSSSMEPTLHCARPASGCEAGGSDRILVDRMSYRFRSPERGEVVVFHVPAAASACGAEAGETFVKRLIGLPGDVIQEDRHGFLRVNGRRLDEPYVEPEHRAQDVRNRNRAWRVPAGRYFFVGDNRGQSCDSRTWGSVPHAGLVGEAFATYWPPRRVSTPLLAGGVGLLGLIAFVALRGGRRARLRRG